MTGGQLPPPRLCTGASRLRRGRASSPAIDRHIRRLFLAAATTAAISTACGQLFRTLLVRYHASEKQASTTCVFYVGEGRNKCRGEKSISELIRQLHGVQRKGPLYIFHVSSLMLNGCLNSF